MGHDFLKARFLYNVKSAARRGLPDVVHLWRSKYLPGGPGVAGKTIRSAALKGHLNVIQWLNEREGHVNAIGHMKTPLVVSHAEVIYWIHEHVLNANMEIRLERAAHRGDLAFLKWVASHSYAYEVTNASIEATAAAGHLEDLKYLLELNPEVELGNALEIAARYGHLHVVSNGF